LADPSASLHKNDPEADTGVTDAIIRDEVQAHGLARRFGLLRRLYEWTLGWAETRYAGKAMAALAFTEAIFFPVPADVLLIALCLGRPRSSFRWATLCTFWSVLGGTAAMFMGLAVGKDRVVEAMGWLGMAAKADQALALLKAYGFGTVAVAALTPVPYSVCSWLAGFSELDWWQYVIASSLFRPMRFFGVAGLVYWLGPTAKRLIDKYFNLATWVFMALLIGAYFALRYLGKLFEA
jgi:membrane protein YqaA with SNARE-associated domain